MHDTKSKTKLTLRTQSITQMLQAKYDTHIKKHDTKKYNERPLKKKHATKGQQHDIHITKHDFKTTTHDNMGTIAHYDTKYTTHDFNKV